MIANIVIEGNFAYSFMLGMLAAVNPCGFVLLPAYLLYFLGIDGGNQGVSRAPLQRALRVSAAVSSGFLAVFLIVGSISRLFTQWIELHAKYAGFAIGIALVGLGIAMLFGWKPSFVWFSRTNNCGQTWWFCRIRKKSLVMGYSNSRGYGFK